MAEKLQQISKSLKSLEDALEKSGIPEDLQSFGTHSSPLGKTSIIRIVSGIRKQIEDAPEISLPQELENDLPEIERQIQSTTTNLVPQLGGGNAPLATPNLLGLLWNIQLRFAPVLTWVSIPQGGQLPISLAKRAETLQNELNKIEKQVEKIQKEKQQLQDLFDEANNLHAEIQQSAASAQGLAEQSKTSSSLIEETSSKITSALTESEKNAISIEKMVNDVAPIKEILETTATQSQELANNITSLSGKAVAQAESIAKFEQQTQSAAEASTKAREVASNDSAQISNNLINTNKNLEEILSKKNEVDDIAKKITALEEEAIAADQQAQFHAQQAEGWAKKSQDAYRLVTTTGLAGAFNQRAISLNRNSFIWLAVLVAALFAAAHMGGQRVSEISGLLRDGKADGVVLLIQTILSLFTVGAPVWMAWLSTKQISHSFRLAEDYGYKASIAKAYEGFRDEAIRIDPRLESQLLGSTLQRLDENPLRLVADNQPGSPLHEMLQQPWFKDAMDTIPEFKQTVLRALSRTPSAKVDVPVTPKPTNAQATPEQT